jgi:hypothetical protein
MSLQINEDHFDWLEESSSPQLELQLSENQRNKEFAQLFNQGYKEGIDWSNENYH